MKIALALENAAAHGDSGGGSKSSFEVNQTAGEVEFEGSPTIEWELRLPLSTRVLRERRPRVTP